MATFRLNCIVAVSAYTEVEAETQEQAIAIARKRGVVLGGIAGVDADQSWVIDDADGTPERITIDDL